MAGRGTRARARRAAVALGGASARARRTSVARVKASVAEQRDYLGREAHRWSLERCDVFPVAFLVLNVGKRTDPGGSDLFPVGPSWEGGQTDPSRLTVNRRKRGFGEDRGPQLGLP